MGNNISFEHNKLISFIWSVADDCLRDNYVRGKYRDIIPLLEKVKPFS